MNGYQSKPRIRLIIFAITVPQNLRLAKAVTMCGETTICFSIRCQSTTPTLITEGHWMHTIRIFYPWYWTGKSGARSISNDCYRFDNGGWIVEFYPTSRSYFMSDGTVSPAIDIVELKIKEGDQHGETPICLSIQIDFDYKDFKFVIDRMLNGKTCITPTKE